MWQVCFKFCFKNRLEQNSHEKIHDENREFVCKFCNKRYPKKFTLNDHMRKYHTMVENFKCNICDKNFKLERVLKRHNMEQHEEGSRLFNCSHCNYSSKRPTAVRHHLKNVHCQVLPDQSYVPCLLTNKNQYQQILTKHQQIKKIIPAN